jgi:hypothetical protein
MGQAQQADDLVMMFADAAWKPRLGLAFEGRRAAIWLWLIPSPFVRRMVRQSPFEACGARAGRRFGDDIYGLHGEAKDSTRLIRESESVWRSVRFVLGLFFP